MKKVYRKNEGYTMKIAVDYDKTIFFEDLNENHLVKMVEVLKNISKAGHEVVVFTGRDEPVDSLVSDAFKVIDGNTDRKFGSQWKINNYKKHNFDVIIDDNASVLEQYDIPIKILINDFNDWKYIEKLLTKKDLSKEY